jgi:hypothetical protein
MNGYQDADSMRSLLISFHNPHEDVDFKALKTATISYL